MHMLPLIMQLLPELPLVYDDDTAVPGLTAAKAGQPPWVWLAACGDFFLVDVERRAILSCPHGDGGFAALVAHYLQATGKTIQAVEVDPATFAAASAHSAAAPSAHVELRG